jgi:transcriptional regulator with XRE-family HTH domain
LNLPESSPIISTNSSSSKAKEKAFWPDNPVNLEIYELVMPESRPAITPTAIFPKRLKAARELRGFNQEELGERSGLQGSAISHFETGGRKPSFDNLKRLADALGVSTDYLLGRTDDPEGHAAPNDPLYRDVQRLNKTNRDLASRIIRQLGTPSEEDD